MRSSPVLMCVLALAFVSPPRGVAGERTASPQFEPYFFALSVKDVDRSVAFYEQVFGFELVRDIDDEENGFRIRLLRRDSAFLELSESKSARSFSDLQPPLRRRYMLHGVFKIGFRVDNLDAVEKMLGDMGIPLRGRVITESDGSMRSLQVQDPDGNVIQVFEMVGAG